MPDLDMKKKLVCIEWIDADGESGWSAYDPEAKLTTIKSFGILVNKTDDHIAHADSYCHESKMWSGLGRIPTGMIKSVKLIAWVDL